MPTGNVSRSNLNRSGNKAQHTTIHFIPSDKRELLVGKIRKIINKLIDKDELPKVNFSDYLSEKLNYEYHYLSNLFSDVEGITVEHYLITQKIERVKRLLKKGKLTLKEIAWKLHYSSPSHLSSQFKRVTGMTPSQFRDDL